MTEQPEPTTGGTQWGTQLPSPATEAGAHAPALLCPVLRSEAAARLLAELLVDPDPDLEYSLSALATHTGVAVATAHTEIAELVEAGVLGDRRTENDRWVHTIPAGVPSGLVELVTVGYGAKPLIERSLAAVPGIEQALIFGSWAARYAGLRGRPPYDIDLLIIGGVDRDALFDIADDVQRLVRREVHVTMRTMADWETGNGFSRHVMEQPHIVLHRTPLAGTPRAANAQLAAPSSPADPR
jgi:hypothetical protein